MSKIYIPKVHDAYPDFEHGHMFPCKIKQEFVYDEKFEYRVKSKKRKVLRFFIELLLNILVPIVCFFGFKPKYTNKKVFKKHKDELKNGFMTTSNHVFPLDNIVLRTLLPFRRVEFPMWREGAESTSGWMYRIGGGIVVPNTLRGVSYCMKNLDDVIKEHKWLHVYPEAACWEYYAPIREYKDGTFRIAVEHNIPVFPIAYSFRQAKGLFRLWKGKKPLVNVNVGEPIYPNKELTGKDAVKDLCKRVHLETVKLAGYVDEEENEKYKSEYKYYPYINPYIPQYEKLKK